MKSLLLSVVCCLFLLAPLSGVWSAETEVEVEIEAGDRLLPSGCEACKTYHEHLFDAFSSHGRVEALDRSFSVCRDNHFWHIADNMHAHSFKQACEIIESTKDSHFKDDLTLKEYRQWPLGEIVEEEDHNSRQLLAKVKREACVDTLKVCWESEIPAPLSRSRTDCERCELVVRSLAGYLSRYEMDHVSEYRRESLLEKKLEEETLCADLDKAYFDDPHTKSTKDLQDYCSDFISQRQYQIHEAFRKHILLIPSLLSDLCPSPCALQKEKEEL